MQTEEPSGLAVLVTRNGAAWLPRTLRSLARQTHPRLGVLAIDNASTDGSADLLERALGSRRVIRVEENLGFAGSIRRVLEVPAVRDVDFLLLLHDDVALAPQAVARLVEEAGRVQGGGAGPARGGVQHRPLRLSALAPRGGGDRSGPVRHAARGAVRVVRGDADLPGG